MKDNLLKIQIFSYLKNGADYYKERFDTDILQAGYHFKPIYNGEILQYEKFGNCKLVGTIEIEDSIDKLIHFMYVSGYGGFLWQGTNPSGTCKTPIILVLHDFYIGEFVEGGLIDGED